MSNKRKCLICSKLVGNLGLHIKVHKITMKEYYHKFHYEEGDGECKTCGKPTEFKNLARGYLDYCSQTCAGIDHWTDEEYRKMMVETARNTMTKGNAIWWEDPEYEEMRQRVFSGRSERMTAMNEENWKDPNYRAEVKERMREFMSNKENKSNMDWHSFMRFKDEYPYGVFYIIYNEGYDLLKIGVSRSPEEDPLGFFYRKVRKHGSTSKYEVYRATIKEVADLELKVKLKLTPVEGSTEWFTTDNLNDIKELINGSNIKLVESKVS